MGEGAARERSGAGLDEACCLFFFFFFFNLLTYLAAPGLIRIRRDLVP